MKGSSSHTSESNPHVSEDTLLDLLHGLIPKAEADRLLAHLAVCPHCEEVFRDRVAERERLRATRVLRSVPGGDLVIEAPREAPAHRPEAGSWIARRWADITGGFRRPYALAGGLAAAVAVLALVLLPYLGGSPGSDSLVWLPAALDDARFRSSNPNGAAEDLTAGLDAYANRDIDEAVRLLERAEATGNLETVRKVYLGSALAMKGAHAEAAEVLEEVASRTLPDPWGSEARWTLYIALEKLDRKAEADSLLSLLAAESGEVGARAARVSRRLDRE